MMMVALLMRPWILDVRWTGAAARILADDARVFAAGKGAPERAVTVFRRLWTTSATSAGGCPPPPRQEPLLRPRDRAAR
eukprot:6923890-Lingulodinium_polyedra.AAC.1